jgi:hypothetical protein
MDDKTETLFHRHPASLKSKGYAQNIRQTKSLMRRRQISPPSSSCLRKTANGSLKKQNLSAADDGTFPLTELLLNGKRRIREINIRIQLFRVD